MTTPDPAAVRAWARDNGYTISERGRVPAEVREAYAAAQGSAKKSPARTAAAAKKVAVKKAPAKTGAADKGAPAKVAPAKTAPAKAGKAAPAKAAKKAPAKASAAEKPAQDQPPTEPGSAPLTDPDKQQSGAPEDRRLIALAEQISALAARVDKLEKAAGTEKPSRFRRKSR